MSERIVYCNTFGWGNGHEMFNAGLLEMCLELSKENKVICRATKSNYKVMTNLLFDNAINCSNLKYKPIYTISGEGKYSLLTRYIFGALLTLWYMIISKKNDLIIIPFNNLFATKWINRLNRLLNRSIVIFSHGELEFIASDINKKGLLSIQLNNRCRQFFLNPKQIISQGLYFSVLGAKIKENLKEHLPYNIWERFQVMDHPYFFPKQPLEKHQYNQILKVGTCGTMNNSKGVDQMIEFAHNCINQHLNIYITHIGKVYHKCQYLIESGVNIPSADRDLSRKEFNNLISELDVMLFFYPSSNYKITASGAIMDAIAMRKPIVALKNDYFEYVFHRFGQFGYLVDSISQMEETISQICDRSLSITFDFDSIQSKFTPIALLEQFEVIVDKITLEK